MTTLPHTFYEAKNLPQDIYQDPVKIEYPTFYQGEDVKISFYLVYEDSPVEETKYDLEVIIKKNVFAQNVLWRAVFNTGLYRVSPDKIGYFFILLPAEISSLFLPGLYHLDVTLKEKNNTGLRNLKTVILRSAFNLELSTTSPNPNLKNTQNVEVYYDLEQGVITKVTTSTEPTVPENIDISKY